MNRVKLIALVLALPSLFFGVKAQDRAPELIIQTGHTNQVDAIGVSTDGKLLATGSSDNRLKLWDVASGAELRTFANDHRIFFNSITFVAGNRRLAVVGSTRANPIEKTILILDTKSGDVIHTLAGNFGPISFSPDGEAMAVVRSQTQIVLMTVATGKDIRSLGAGDQEVNAVAFSPDGKTLAAARQAEIDLWDVETGKVINTVKGNDRAVTSVTFSQNGEVLVIGGSDGLIRWLDPKTAQELGTFQLDTNQSDNVFVSRDGNLIAAQTFVTSPEYSKKLVVIDPAQRVDLSVMLGYGAALLAHDRRQIFSSEPDGSIKLWTVGEDAPVARFGGGTNALFSVAFGATGNEIAAGSRGSSITWWKSGQVPYLLAGHGKSVLAVRFNPADGRLVSASWDKSVRIWADGREVNSLTGHSAEVQSLDISSDGALIASGGRDKTIKLWDAVSGRALRTLTGHSDETAWGGQKIDGRVEGVAFSPDNRRLASVGTDRNLKMWNIPAGTQAWSVSTETTRVYSLAFSPDGKTIVGGGFKLDYAAPVVPGAGVNGALVLWDASTGKVIRDAKGLDDWIYTVAFSPDSRTIATGSLNSKLQLWDAATGKEIRRFSGVSSPLFGIDFSPDGKLIAGAGEDGVVKIWDVASGKELCTLITFGEYDWLVATPEGFFDGSPAAWKRLFWRFNDNTFDTGAVELYFNDFFHPNLLQDVLAGAAPKPRGGQELARIDRRRPSVKIEGKPGSGRIVEMAVEAADNTEPPLQSGHGRSGGAQDLRLFRNGSLVRVWHGDLFKLGASDGCEQISGSPRRVRCSAKVPVVAGENQFTAYAFNNANVKSSDDSIKISGSNSLRKDGVLYVLAIGVNKYANPRYDLNFAVPDVVDMGKALSDAQAKLSAQGKAKQYGRVEVITLANEDATKSNILNALRRFTKPESLEPGVSAAAALELAKIKPAEPEDALVIYYAGHGVSRGPRFYLLPHNFTGSGENSTVVEGISDIELNDVLETVDAGRLLMAIDACQSGQALGGASEGRAPMNSKGLAQLAYDKGMSILTAAQSQQAALEAVTINGKEIRHGLLTYALLEGFTADRADKDNNRQLWEREWLDYASIEVPLLQMAAMKQRSFDIKKGGRGSEIVYVNGDKNSDPKKRAVQTPRVFYRREPQVNPFVIAAR